MPNKSYSHQQSLIASQQQLQCMAYEDQAIQPSCICFRHFPSVNNANTTTRRKLHTFLIKTVRSKFNLYGSSKPSTTTRCGLHHNLLLNSVEAKFVYVVSPTFSNFQFPKKKKKGNSTKLHQWRTTTNSQKLHTILIKIV